VLRRVIAAAFLLCLGLVQASGSPAEPAAFRVARLEETAQSLETAMGMHNRVRVLVVPENKLVISVEVLPAPEVGYQVVMERRFYEMLSDEEITAAIAHEIGHVWIYSHHPFLQTEALANEIAMKAVSRKALASLYGKLWSYTGVPGDLQEL